MHNSDTKLTSPTAIFLLEHLVKLDINWGPDDKVTEYIDSLIRCAHTRHSTKNDDLFLASSQVVLLAVLETGVAISSAGTKVFSCLLSLLKKTIIETNVHRSALSTAELNLLLKANRTYTAQQSLVH